MGHGADKYGINREMWMKSHESFLYTFLRLFRIFIAIALKE